MVLGKLERTQEGCSRKQREENGRSVGDKGVRVLNLHLSAAFLGLGNK